MTVYSKTEKQQFLNHQDDRQRGVTSSPFGHYGDVTPTTKETQKGPFPGDEAYFQFGVYDSVAQTKKVGSGVLLCRYNFAKNAYCDAVYQFGNGNTLVAAGAFSFSATEFTLAIVGGTGTYSGATGDLEISAGVGDTHVQRLKFTLT
jgi:hypothetical protein